MRKYLPFTTRMWFVKKLLNKKNYEIFKSDSKFKRILFKKI